MFLQKHTASNLRVRKTHTRRRRRHEQKFYEGCVCIVTAQLASPSGRLGIVSMFAPP